MIISRFLCTGRKNPSVAFRQQPQCLYGKFRLAMLRRDGCAPNEREGNIMKEVISELLQRKEQQEEDLYFECLNREVIEKLHRQAVTGDRSGTATRVHLIRASVQPPDTGR
jgi:hypothetical protein